MLARPIKGFCGASRRSRLALARLLSLGIAGALLAGCAGVVQSHLVGNADLTALVSVNRFPIYWVGGTFRGEALTQVSEDAGGGYSLQYGDCSVGGQAICVAPLVIVTTPRSSFNTEPESGSDTMRERSLTGIVREGGETIEFATGEVVVEIYAQSAALARAAATTMAPINRLGTPGSALPAAAPASESPAEPLPGQLPHSLSITHGSLHQDAARTQTTSSS